MITAAPVSPFNPDLTQALVSIEQVSICLLVAILVVILWPRFETFVRDSHAGPIWVWSGFALFLALGGWMVSTLGIDGFPLAAGVAAGLVLSVASPVFAICFFSAMLLLRPWEILPTDSAMLAMPRILAIVVMASWILGQARAREFRVRLAPVDALLAVFALLTYTSVFISPNWVEAHATYVDSFSRSLIIYFLVLQVVRDRRDVLAFATTIGIAGMTLAALTEYRLLYDPLLQRPGRRAELFGLLGDPNDLSAMLLFALPLLVDALLRTGLPRRLKWFVCASLVATSVGVIVQTQSRGAFVGLIAMAFAWGLTRLKGRRQVWQMAIVVLVLGMGLQFSLRRSEDDLSASRASRLSYWKAGVRMAARYPLLGVGFGGYPYRYSEFLGDSSQESGRRTAHSTWVLVLAETGLFSFAAFVSLFAVALVQAWRMRAEFPALLPAYAGYVGAASFLSHAYLIQPYLLLALIFSAWRISKDPAIERVG